MSTARKTTEIVYSVHHTFNGTLDTQYYPALMFGTKPECLQYIQKAPVKYTQGKSGLCLLRNGRFTRIVRG